MATKKTAPASKTAAKAPAKKATPAKKPAAKAAAKKASTPPKHYQKLAARYPKVLDAVQALGKTVQAAGPLDEKTVRLVQLAAAAAERSTGSVQSHARRALEAGASRAEIEHALLSLTSTLGFPNVAAALNWVEEVLG